MNIRKTNLFILIALLSLFSGSCSKKTEKSTRGVVKETSDSLVIVTIGVDSLNALQVLQQEHKPMTVSSAMGTFVRGIDGIENDTKTFWLFEINGEMADKAADNIMTHAGDTIKWYFRKIGAKPDSTK